MNKRRRTPRATTITTCARHAITPAAEIGLAAVLLGLGLGLGLAANREPDTLRAIILTMSGTLGCVAGACAGYRAVVTACRRYDRARLELDKLPEHYRHNVPSWRRKDRP